MKQKITLEELRSMGSPVPTAFTPPPFFVSKKSEVPCPKELQYLNEAGNKIIQSPTGSFFVLNAKNRIIGKGPHLSMLWNVAVQNGKPVKEISDNEKRVIQAPHRGSRPNGGKRHSKKNPGNAFHRFPGQPSMLDAKNYLRMIGATSSPEARKEEPACVLVYMDKDYIYDRKNPRGIATK